MLKKYSKEKAFIENQINLLTKNDEIQRKSKENKPTAYRLIQILETINDEEILKPEIIRSFIESISVKTTHAKKSKKYEYKIVIRYLVLDEIIKEFLNNEQSCNIC